jgi:hypothetical protein
VLSVTATRDQFAVYLVRLAKICVPADSCLSSAGRNICRQKIMKHPFLQVLKMTAPRRLSVGIAVQHTAPSAITGLAAGD